MKTFSSTAFIRLARKNLCVLLPDLRVIIIHGFQRALDSSRLLFSKTYNLPTCAFDTFNVSIEIDKLQILNLDTKAFCIDFSVYMFLKWYIYKWEINFVVFSRDTRLEPYSAMKSWCHKATGQFEVSVGRIANHFSPISQRGIANCMPTSSANKNLSVGKTLIRTAPGQASAKSYIYYAIGCSRSAHNIWLVDYNDKSITKVCCVITASQYRLVQLFNVIRATTNQQKSMKWAEF